MATIERMPPIGRVAVCTNAIAVTPDLFGALIAVVAGLAQRLQGPSPELHRITTMGLDVVDHAGEFVLSARLALFAERLHPKLQPCPSTPTLGLIPTIVRRVRLAHVASLR